MAKLNEKSDSSVWIDDVVEVPQWADVNWAVTHCKLLFGMSTKILSNCNYLNTSTIDLTTSTTTTTNSVDAQILWYFWGSDWTDVDTAYVRKTI